MQGVKRLKKDVESYLEDGHKGEIVRDGIHITIMGAPNAGKSSLMNALGMGIRFPELLLFSLVETDLCSCCF